jgi:hypothetical protein
MKSKINSMLIIFFDIKGIAHKEFVLAGQTGNSIPHIAVTFYGECMKMCKEFALNCGNKRTG